MKSKIVSTNFDKPMKSKLENAPADSFETRKLAPAKSKIVDPRHFDRPLE